MINHGEYILCAAIWVDDGNEHVHQPVNINTGLVISGWRHPACFILLSRLGSEEFLTKVRNNSNRTVQGFITSKNRFLNRKEAAELTYEVGQVNKLKKALYSEDLY